MFGKVEVCFCNTVMQIKLFVVDVKASTFDVKASLAVHNGKRQPSLISR